MKINYEKLNIHIGDFVKWFCILFTINGINQKMGSVHMTTLLEFVFPVVGSLFFTLFFSDKAVWPFYKKGEKVWWSRLGEAPKHKNRFIAGLAFLGIAIFLRVIVLR